MLLYGHPPCPYTCRSRGCASGCGGHPQSLPMSSGRQLFRLLLFTSTHAFLLVGLSSTLILQEWLDEPYFASIVTSRRVPRLYRGSFLRRWRCDGKARRRINTQNKWAEDLKSHRLFGSLRTWAQEITKILDRLGSKDFDEWLWGHKVQVATFSYSTTTCSITSTSKS